MQGENKENITWATTRNGGLTKLDSLFPVTSTASFPSNCLFLFLFNCLLDWSSSPLRRLKHTRMQLERSSYTTFSDTDELTKVRKYEDIALHVISIFNTITLEKFTGSRQQLLTGLSTDATCVFSIETDFQSQCHWLSFFIRWVFTIYNPGATVCLVFRDGVIAGLDVVLNRNIDWCIAWQDTTVCPTKWRENGIN